MTLGNAYVVSDACQIKDLDHSMFVDYRVDDVSDACQIKDLDHCDVTCATWFGVSDACQIKDLDHYPYQATTL